ncbi:MAG: hypothetical protein PHY59_06165, partial [Methanobacterium sp.]|nr:hypothetical protein [Methanobacterium sp.]
MQIKNDLNYIRYLKLVSIDKNSIRLKSGSIDKTYSRDDFNTKCVWSNDGIYSNPDHKFNIIIVPSPGVRDSTLNEIWNKQKSDLESDKDGCIQNIVICGVLLVVSTLLLIGLCYACKRC